MADCLMIFAKAPVLGRCKTRLKLPESKALALHRAFVKDVINNSKGEWSQVLWSDDASHPFFEQFDLPVHQQIGHTLGDRMAHGFDEMFKTFDRVMIIGTDAPSLPVRHVRDAFRMLGTYDVVIGPSCDGGYYGLGLTQPCPAVFDPLIPWGEETVCVQTLSILRRLNLSVMVLPFWFDVDRPTDLALLRLISDGSEHPHSTAILQHVSIDGDDQ